MTDMCHLITSAALFRDSFHFSSQQYSYCNLKTPNNYLQDNKMSWQSKTKTEDGSEHKICDTNDSNKATLVIIHTSWWCFSWVATVSKRWTVSKRLLKCTILNVVIIKNQKCCSVYFRIIATLINLSSALFVTGNIFAHTGASPSCYDLHITYNFWIYMDNQLYLIKTSQGNALW